MLRKFFQGSKIKKMIPVSSTTLAPLKINLKAGEKSVMTKAVGNKIGWLHTLSDKEGASFDIQVKDGLGRIKFERKNCKTDTKEFGELINTETLLGEDLEVEITNVQGVEEIQVFLN